MPFLKIHYNFVNFLTIRQARFSIWDFSFISYVDFSKRKDLILCNLVQDIKLKK
jgi:hypothetical protein